MKKKIKELLNQFDLKLGNYNTYSKALTHRSHSSEYNLGYDYERLEWLGDSVMQLIVSSDLFKKVKFHDEGNLSSMRKRIVSNDVQKKVSEKLDLINYCNLGKGVLLGQGTKKIEADIYEAFVGAIFLSEGITKANNFLFKTLLEYVDKNKSFFKETDDYKSIFQELIQKREFKKGDKKNNKIIYELIPSNNSSKIFEIKLKFGEIIFGSGFGKTIGEAERNAAKSAIEKIARN